MKKFIPVLVCVCMVLSLAGCGGSGSSTSSAAPAADSSAPAESTPAAESAASTDAADPAGVVAEGESYDWSVANVLASGAPWAIGLEKYAELLDQYSGGRMKLTVHSGGVLGSEIETLESVQMGTLDMAICSVSSLSGFTESQNVFDLPYLFKSTEEAWRALDSEVGQERCDAMGDSGFKGLGYFENGTYAIGSNKEIRSPGDLEGVRVRSHASLVQSDSFDVVGAFPVSVAWGDIYTSLQQGTIDAVSGTTLTNMYSGKFYEQTKYITITGHHYSPSAVVMNKALWDGLTPEDQEVVQRAFNEAKMYQREVAVETAAKCEEDIKASGVEIINVDADEWAAAMAPVYETWVGQNGVTQELVDAIQAAAAA